MKADPHPTGWDWATAATGLLCTVFVLLGGYEKLGQYLIVVLASGGMLGWGLARVSR